MKLAVTGPGAIGGYIGARLAAVGAEVTFVARGAHLAAIRAPDWLAGAVVRLGRAAGLHTPFHRVALGILKPHAAGTS